MANSPTKITDSVAVELNGPDFSEKTLEELNELLESDDETVAEAAEDELARRFDANQRKMPDRPGPKGSRPAWVEYCVALGADRNYLDNETEHYDGVKGKYVKVPGLQVKDLIELADKLGG